MNKANILVTGDLVLDHHLYEGTRPSPQDQHQRALISLVEWGGADLLRALLVRVELERKIGELWRRRVKQQAGLLKQARLKNPEVPEFKDPPRPVEDDPELGTIDTETETYLSFGALPQPDAQGCITQPLCTAHGYALFSPTPRGRNDENLVWRVSKVLGYGTPHDDSASASTTSMPKLAPLPKFHDVICLDDAGDVFRNLPPSESDKWCLPARVKKHDALPWIVLKLSGDLEHGRLWDRLAQRKDLHRKLAVILAAQELRKMSVRLSRGLSWERSVEHLLFELSHNPEMQRIRTTARHLIVHFSIDAAVWIDLTDRRHPKTVLVFDAANAEAEWAEDFKGNAFAYQTCFAAAICRLLAVSKANNQQLEVGIISNAMEAGLSAMRRLRSDGHGPIRDKAGALLFPKGFPVDLLARELLNPSHSFSRVSVPDSVQATVRKGHPNGSWTILSHSQIPFPAHQPLYGLARQIVLRGEIALSRFPHLRIGKLLTTDRFDMEALRTLRRLFYAYKSESNPGKKPLSIGVFGPPGAGKSFAVKELTLGIFARPGEKEYAGWKEFNLSQFDSVEDLIGAFHQIRDLVLQGIIPVVFWDEFDSSKFKWLQYLLAPMQDGRFQQKEATHTIGKCIFIFAGGTSWTFDSFGEFSSEEDRLGFQLSKGPDFKSRLDGAYDVLGPNQKLVPPKNRSGNPILTAPKAEWKPDPEDIYFPVRRALMIRVVMGVKAEGINFDPGLLTALLQNDIYIHGSRSMEKVVESLKRKNHFDQPLPPVRSALPAPSQMRLHVLNPDAFHRLCREQMPPVLQVPGITLKLAQAVHAYYEKNIRFTGQFNPNAKAWSKLSIDIQRSNEAAARRMPEVLSLAGLCIVPGRATPKQRQELDAFLALHLDLLAEAEHKGWIADRIASGWSYGEQRDDEKRIHPCLKPFQSLPVIEQNKDRLAVMRYPDLTNLIGHRIAFMKPPKARSNRL